MSVSFEMFLIDRGTCDAYTIGQWDKYVRTSDIGTFDEICSLSIDVRWPMGLLAYLYPDDWVLWLAYCRLVGKKPA